MSWNLLHDIWWDFRGFRTSLIILIWCGSALIIFITLQYFGHLNRENDHSPMDGMGYHIFRPKNIRHFGSSFENRGIGCIDLGNHLQRVQMDNIWVNMIKHYTDIPSPILHSSALHMSINLYKQKLCTTSGGSNMVLLNSTKLTSMILPAISKFLIALVDCQFWWTNDQWWIWNQSEKHHATIFSI